MKTMDDRWKEFDKRYPDSDFRALRDARGWQGDAGYLRGHIRVVNLPSERFGFSILPSARIYGMNDLIQETYSRTRVVASEEDALKRAFRMHDITLHIVGNLKERLTAENIREWLDWKDVVRYFSAGFDLYLPSSMLNGNEFERINIALNEAAESQPRCPKCNAVGWRSSMNNLGQTVYRCDSWMCGTSYVMDAEN
jgi:tRNA(Ile2) C34 agmatinyltransferase TiaS